MRLARAYCAVLTLLRYSSQGSTIFPPLWQSFTGTWCSAGSVTRHQPVDDVSCSARRCCGLKDRATMSCALRNAWLCSKL